MEQAIQKAIEGGYEKSDYDLTRFDKLTVVGLPEACAPILLDPLFWQALGKAEGWGKTQNFTERPKDSLLNVWPEEWQVYWHVFIDHIGAKKDVDSFFKKLLK